MRGLRNRVAHGYQSVNPEVLKLTAQLDIPLVKEAVTAQLQKLAQREASEETPRA